MHRKYEKCNGIHKCIHEDRDKSLLRKSLQYFLTIFVFACGAGIGGAYSLYIGNEFIWISCALLLICFVLMFIKSENDMMREDM